MGRSSGLWARASTLLLATGCTTDLDLLVDDGKEDAASGRVVRPDGGVSFPPPHMDPPIGEPGPGIIEPSGAFALTLLHGVVDASRIFFCLADAQGEPMGNPLPEGGLAFGEALALSDLQGVNPFTEDLQLLVVATGQALAQGKSCQGLVAEADQAGTFFPQALALTHLALAAEGGLLDAGSGVANLDGSVAPDPGDAAASSDATVPSVDAGPPTPASIRVNRLPVVPAGTLLADRSYLLNVAGCMGGAYYTNPDERAVCGDSYFPDRPTVTPMLVQLSRLVTSGNPSLQFLQGSLAAGSITLRSVPGLLTGGTQITIATDVIAGVISPYPPLRSVAAASFGLPLPSVNLQAESDSGVTWQTSWYSALETAGQEQLESLQGYTLVLLGPNPWLQEEATWWNAPKIAIVRNSPP